MEHITALKCLRHTTLSKLLNDVIYQSLKESSAENLSLSQTWIIRTGDIFDFVSSGSKQNFCVVVSENICNGARDVNLYYSCDRCNAGVVHSEKITRTNGCNIVHILNDVIS